MRRDTFVSMRSEKGVVEREARGEEEAKWGAKRGGDGGGGGGGGGESGSGGDGIRGGVRDEKGGERGRRIV